jgi:thioredoxin reductase (NADPH)
MLERARQNEKITFRTNVTVEEVLGDGAVSGVRIRDTRSGAEETLEATGMFVAIGHDPRSQLVAGQVHLDEEGYVLVDSPSTYTNLPGVFACGDLTDKTYQQAVTAAGSGCTASIDAERWLAENPNTREPRTAPKPTVDSEREPTGPAGQTLEPVSS